MSGIRFDLRRGLADELLRGAECADALGRRVLLRLADGSCAWGVVQCVTEGAEFCPGMVELWCGDGHRRPVLLGQVVTVECLPFDCVCSRSPDGMLLADPCEACRQEMRGIHRAPAPPSFRTLRQMVDEHAPLAATLAEAKADLRRLPQSGSIVGKEEAALFAGAAGSAEGRLAARTACENDIRVVLDAFARDEKQALLYLTLRRLGWSEEKAETVLAKAGWKL